MIINYFWRLTRWRFVAIFAVVMLAMSAVTGHYANAAWQKASVDYTILTNDIMQAQQIPFELQETIKETSQQKGSNIIEYINTFIFLSKQQLEKLQANIDKHRFLKPSVEYLRSDFIDLNYNLINLAQRSRIAEQSPEQLALFQRKALALGDQQQWIYEKLLNETHAVSLQQRTVMRHFCIAASIMLVLGISGAITLTMAVVCLHRQRNQMHQLMLTDELTGLYNRRYLVNAAFAALTQAQRDRTSLSILLIDIDKFKHINDTYGHPAGDEVLRQISSRLQQLCRPSDTLARIGGEEFCLLMPNTHTNDALQVADRLRKEIEIMSPDTISGIAAPTISIGVTTSDEGAHIFEQLYCCADQALYQAKAFGRNRVESLLPSNPLIPADEEKNIFSPAGAHSLTHSDNSLQW